MSVYNFPACWSIDQLELFLVTELYVSLSTTISSVFPCESQAINVFPSVGCFGYTNCNPVGILSVILFTYPSMSPSLYTVNVYVT